MGQLISDERSILRPGDDIEARGVDQAGETGDGLLEHGEAIAGDVSKLLRPRLTAARPKAGANASG